MHTQMGEHTKTLPQTNGGYTLHYDVHMVTNYI